jgi:hypothetical protein
VQLSQGQRQFGYVDARVLLDEMLPFVQMGEQFAAIDII